MQARRHGATTSAIPPNIEPSDEEEIKKNRPASTKCLLFVCVAMVALTQIVVGTSVFLAMPTLWQVPSGTLWQMVPYSAPDAAVSTAGFYQHPSWLQSCRHIYLDMGSNLGVQTRKLFEPAKYTGKLMPLMDKHYGPPSVRQAKSNVSGLCALGFEPNPRHHPRLKRLETAYLKRGWHVHFYPFAAWSHEEVLRLFRTATADDPHSRDEGAGIRTEGTEVYPEYTDVRTVDMAAFIRSLPPHSIGLWKMDIEGAEWEVIARLLKERLLSQEHVKEMTVEVHDHGNTTNWPYEMSFDGIRQAIQSTEGEQSTIVNAIDDEEARRDVDNDFSGAFYNIPERWFIHLSGLRWRY